MKTKIKEVMAILNINAKEAEQGVIITYKIEQKLKELNPSFLDSFIIYCEKHFNSLELQYQTGYQKFLTLFRKFQEGYVEQKASKYKSVREKEIFKLVDKVAKVKPAQDRATIRGIKLKYSHIINSDTKEPFFSSDEIATLSLVADDINGVLWQIEAFGVDAVANSILDSLSKQVKKEAKKMIQRNMNQISQNSNKVISLLKSAAKTV